MDLALSVDAPSDAQWLQMMLLRGATRRTSRCDCRISCQMRGCRCCRAVCLLPHPQSSFAWSCGSPRMCVMHTSSPWYISVCFGRTASSLCGLSRPPCFYCGHLFAAATLTVLHLQHLLCKVCLFPLASVDGSMAQVRPGALVPKRPCTTDVLRSPDGKTTWPVPL